MLKQHRRSSSLVLYWESGSLVCEDYVTHERASVTPEVVQLLDQLGAPKAGPSSPGDGNAAPGKKEALAALASLRRLGFVQGNKSAPPKIAGQSRRAVLHEVAGHFAKRNVKLAKTERRLGSWWWGAPARHFFFSTKDAHRPTTTDERLAHIRKLRRTAPAPSIYKTYRGAAMVHLEKLKRFSSPVAEALSAVQNTRSYRPGPIPLAALNEILRLTWGARGTLRTKSWGALLDKTSYSGGNRHPVEVYPVVVSVEGLKPGLYHYNVRDHGLELLKRGHFARLARRIGNEQEWIRDASVYFLMTAVLKRTMWKYRHDYSLRTVFCDVGHLSQNVYLVAQSLGLGACTTYALNHSLAERFIGLDGVDESFLCLSMVGWKQ